MPPYAAHAMPLPMPCLEHRYQGEAGGKGTTMMHGQYLHAIAIDCCLLVSLVGQFEVVFPLLSMPIPGQASTCPSGAQLRLTWAIGCLVYNEKFPLYSYVLVSAGALPFDFSLAQQPRSTQKPASHEWRAWDGSPHRKWPAPESTRAFDATGRALAPVPAAARYMAMPAKATTYS